MDATLITNVRACNCMSHFTSSPQLSAVYRDGSRQLVGLASTQSRTAHVTGAGRRSHGLRQFQLRASPSSRVTGMGADEDFTLLRLDCQGGIEEADHMFPPAGRVRAKCCHVAGARNDPNLYPRGVE